MKPDELYATLKAIDTELPSLISVLFGGCSESNCSCRERLKTDADAFIEMLSEHAETTDKTLKKGIESVLQNPNVKLLMSCQQQRREEALENVIAI